MNGGGAAPPGRGCRVRELLECAMAGGMDSKYLKDLQQVLEAEAALARQGVDLLADPEYRALRERFVDGDMPIDEFVARVEGLAEVRPDDEEEDEESDGSDADDELDDEDDADFDDPEELQVLKDLRDLGETDDSASGDDRER